MISVTGTYHDGAVRLDAPVDLPEGAHVQVTLDPAPARSGETEDFSMDGRPWPKTDAEIQEWIAWFDALEPIMTEEEYQRFTTEREEQRRQQQLLTRRSWEKIERAFR